MKLFLNDFYESNVCFFKIEFSQFFKFLPNILVEFIKLVCWFCVLLDAVAFRWLIKLEFKGMNFPIDWLRFDSRNNSIFHEIFTGFYEALWVIPQLFELFLSSLIFNSIYFYIVSFSSRILHISSSFLGLKLDLNKLLNEVRNCGNLMYNECECKWI
jgi:hypothetical protein